MNYKKTKHEGLRYQCKECDSNTTKKTLSTRKQTKYEGIWSIGDQSGYAATHGRYLGNSQEV